MAWSEHDQLRVEELRRTMFESQRIIYEIEKRSGQDDAIGPESTTGASVLAVHRRRLAEVRPELDELERSRLACGLEPVRTTIAQLMPRLQLRTAPKVEIFFNRPGDSIDLARLYEDVGNARGLLVVASAWFTDYKLAGAIIRASAPLKLVIFNQGDANRGDRVAFRLIEDDPRIFLLVLGDADWKGGIMHHKFVVVDRKVSWIGSYNFTLQAQNNYELLARIEDEGTATTIYQEASDLFHQAIAADDGKGESNDWSNPP